MMAFHFHFLGQTSSADETARDVFFKLRSRCCAEKIEDMHAFHFKPPQEELAASMPPYDARREFARMGIGPKAAEGPGAAWRITDINKDYSYSSTYPNVLCVPRAVSDNTLRYGGAFRSKARIPALAYLHFNGGSITRCSQPLIGIGGKRSPQDERLVSAIFSSHTPSNASPEDSPEIVPAEPDNQESFDRLSQDAEVANMSLDEVPVPPDEVPNDNPASVNAKIYGSKRSNLIVDARPIANMYANKVTGGGVEDVEVYKGTADIPVGRIFLNIENIHHMRKSLQKVIDSLGEADYLNLPPNQELLRKSKWLEHIAKVMEGSAIIARAVGLAASHVLTHCSDGWDRTSQVSALAQVMLDPHYRTLEGLITLVQKDFLSFGHKFRDRNCILGCEKWFGIENERIAPGDSRDNKNADPNGFNNLGAKAFSSARTFFEKSRSNLFRKENSSEDSTSRPPSPPANPLVHSVPTASAKDDKNKGADENEMAPIFHQFLDCVYQLQRQYPHAFEFNERFLLRLLYQTYSCQYGEFLFNNEKERSQHQDKLPSVWPYFLARRKDFTNPEYAPRKEEELLMPKRGRDQALEIVWWSRLFGKPDHEMNNPRTLAMNLDAQLSTLSLDDKTVQIQDPSDDGSNLREAKSTPNFQGRQAMSLDDQLESSRLSNGGVGLSQSQQSSINRQDTDPNVLARYAGASSSAMGAAGSSLIDEHAALSSTRSNGSTYGQTEGQGDPLGATNSVVTSPQTNKLDFAAFATGAAYREI
jgi:myotubularin-related protein 6/7/8